MQNTEKILKYWYYLEYFTPIYPDNVCIEENYMQNEALPWYENKSEYTIYIGKANVEELQRDVYKKFKINMYREKNNKDTICAVIKVNKDGKYINKSFAICNYFYACSMIVANKDGESDLNQESIELFNDKINDIIVDKFTDIESVDRLKDINSLILSQLNNYNESYSNILIRKSKRNDTSMVQSSYIDDISRIQDSIVENDSIMSYIDVRNDNEKIMVDSDVNELKKILNIEEIPTGRWPSNRKSYLTQQLAINVATKDNKTTSITAPSGTGKGEIIKEIIANNIVKRAEFLMKYDNLENCLDIMEIEKQDNPYYKEYYLIPEELKKLSTVLVSNKEFVETLHQSKFVTSDKCMTNLFENSQEKETYFSDIATKISKSDSWGLMVADLNLEDFNFIDILSVENGSMLGSYFDNPEKNIPWNKAKKSFKNKYSEVLDFQNKAIKDVENLKNFKKVDSDISVLLEEKSNLESMINDLKNKINSLGIIEDDKKEELIKVEDELKEASAISIFRKVIIRINENDKKGVRIEDAQARKDALNIQLNNLMEQMSIQREELAGERKRIASVKDEIEKKVFEVEENNRLNREMKSKYGENYIDDDSYSNIINNKKMHLKSPWLDKDEHFNRLREELFYESLQVHKSFIQNSKEVKHNLKMLFDVWKKGIFSEDEKMLFFSELFQTLMLLIPVMSVKLEDVSELFKYIEKEKLGTVIIDDANRIAPHQSLGLLWRGRKNITFGDRKRCKPLELDSKVLLSKYAIEVGIDKTYTDSMFSLQTLSDSLSIYCANLDGSNIGSPLLVNDECIDPMFSISNEIAYSNRLFNNTEKNDEKRKFCIEKSTWIDCSGSEKGNKNHYVANQGRVIREYFIKAFRIHNEELFKKNQRKLLIVSPFKSVVDGIKNELLAMVGENKKYFGVDEEYLMKWFDYTIGTIDHFQGYKFDEVIIVLGCDDETGTNAARWVGNDVTLINVGINLARYRCAIIGDAKLWKEINFVKDVLKKISK